MTLLARLARLTAVDPDKYKLPTQPPADPNGVDLLSEALDVHQAYRYDWDKSARGLRV